MPATRLLLTFALAAFLASAGVAHAAPLRFAVVQPGQPGSPEEARPVMEALAGWLAARLGVPVSGVYVNDPAAVRGLLDADRPDFGIVSLGVYLAEAERAPMTPLAGSRPGGQDKDVWRLMTRGGSAGLPASGTVLGSMLLEPGPSACLLFGKAPGELAFSLELTDRPLRALRDVARGTAAGVVLDAQQHASLAALPAAAELAVAATSAPLPTSPVVWLGDPANSMAARVGEAFRAMRDDAGAADLLKLLLTEGFGPPDHDLEPLRARCGHAESLR